MKVLFVADVSTASVIGGAERVLYEQSIRLHRRGHDVHILTRALPGQKQGRAVINDVTEWRYRLDLTNVFSSIGSILYKCRKLFVKLQTLHCFGIIIIHQPFTAFGVSTVSLPKETKKIYICHSLSFEEYISRNKKPEKFVGKVVYFLNVKLRKWIERKVLNSADGIIVLSRFTGDKLNGVYNISENKILVVPGGVDLERFSPSDNKIEVRRKLNIPETPMILFTVRNLVQRMGLENLISAMRYSVQKGLDIYLIIGGAGPLKSELTAMADRMGLKNFIRLEGFIPEDRLPEYYKMADLFVLPTRELEGFGLVTLEAMATGVPVLGTPVGGTIEILGQFDPTFLFTDTSASSMAERIFEKYRIFRERPDEWKEISRRCRQFAEDHYSWERHVGELEKYF